MLTLTDLSIEHRLTGVSATVQAGRLVNIIGPNGAGKSTLLAAAAGLLPYREARCSVRMKLLNCLPSVYPISAPI